MRVLLAGPRHDGGSIPPYLDVLTAALRRHGVRVDRVGSAGVPYDAAAGVFWPVERIVEAAERLLDDVNLDVYDLVSLHYGNLEIEQLLPALWGARRRPPVVYHAHSLAPTLFTTHVPDLALRAAVAEGTRRADGYVFFGAYARAQLTRDADASVPTTVAWLPTTIPAGHHGSASARLRTALSPKADVPVASLYGYAAPWKDPATLLAACERTTTPMRLVLAGPFRSDPTQTGTDLSDVSTGVTQRGPVEVALVDAYLHPAQRRALARGSDLAIFPYRPQATFQGSGAVADYLAHSVPVLATDVANMAELVGDAGLIVEPTDSEALARALDRLAEDQALRTRLADAAARRAPRFSADHHARTCLRLYQQVIETTRVHS